jgi:hypothetical protein
MDASLDRIEEPPHIPQHAIDAMGNALGYWSSLVADKRAHPDDALASRLCEVEVTDDDGTATRLSDDEVIGFLMLIGAAGTETVMKLLANAVVLFQRNPDEWQKVLDDPASIPGAVEEVLRYDSSVIHWRRRTTRPVELSGVELPEGADVLVSIGAANRDPEVFTDPDRFDIRRREASEHLSFGNGPHYCLGAPLARLEARVVLEELTAALPSLRLAPDQTYTFHPIIGFRGPTSVQVEWEN